MAKEFLYIANWKAYFTHTQASAWLTDNKAQLASLSAKNSIILCPSFTDLATTKDYLNSTNVKLGAQDCAPELTGAYTGQVSAGSIKELGCSYCIIGHSEQRDHQSDTVIADKAKVLISQGITPIICVGETQEERNAQQTELAIKRQLEPILKLDMDSIKPIIAYEPTWAIGTGELPTSKQIFKELNTIKSCFGSTDIHMVYGGSITSKTSGDLKKIENLDGFLIGKASTDIQELEKIV
ncbi:MAG TPA: triose-phosphate isomerase family protein [Candidatus Babeliales bacterium]|nr:triose-phosphate isomerase family protein [Candidatus Babeliales bacterium]